MPDTDVQARPASDPRLQRIEHLGFLLDNSIRLPIIGYRIGWDAIIGLIPGFGDVAGLLLSAYIVYESARFGVPKATLGRMVLNVGIEALVGAVPVLGDLFDATFKANARNIDLLQKHGNLTMASPQRQRDRRFLLLVFGGLLVMVVVLAALLIWGVVWLWNLGASP
ncbi:MAG TPA: DUF4112 domain-containing protein [Rhodothermales bacterium]|nr:DUF4112 domain-containing protein [Rhodothermales bacterium]